MTKEPDPLVAAPEAGAPSTPASVTTAAPRTRRAHRRRRRALFEWLVVVVVAIVVAVVVRSFVFETFYIPSGSMEPTLEPGDRIIVDKLSFDLHPVVRGDIVVFRRPPGWPPQYADLVKRIIGLPGETLWVHGGHVWVDTGACAVPGTCTGPTINVPEAGPVGTVTTTVALRQLREPWLPRVDRGVTGPGPSAANGFSLVAPYRVPAGDYFVMGDNRTLSADSRYYGPVPRSDLVGEVVFRYWPLSRIGGL
jgi:signal peptidase I